MDVAVKDIVWVASDPFGVDRRGRKELAQKKKEE